MRIPQEILDQVNDDPSVAVISACKFVESEFSGSSSWDEEDEYLLYEIYALITTLKEVGRIQYLADAPDLAATFPHICVNLSSFMDKVKKQLELLVRNQANARRIEQIKNHFSITINNAFGYEFTDGDLKRIQQLINDLREMVSANTELDEGHKQRMLKRLEKMQSELHKKMSDISRFYELMGDAGVALGRLGEGAKPFVDRIKEIVDIGWKSQARAEQLQTDAENPLIGNESEQMLLK